MATFVMTNAYCLINSVDLSDHVREIEVTYEAELEDDTNMGDSSRVSLPGLLNWRATVRFAQDYAAAKVDATLFPLIGAAAFACEFRPDAGAVAATNPKFTGNALLQNYPPVAGAVGRLAEAGITLQGVTVLTRATS